jgi:hypothetical protein
MFAEDFAGAQAEEVMSALGITSWSETTWCVCSCRWNAYHASGHTLQIPIEHDVCNQLIVLSIRPPRRDKFASIRLVKKRCTQNPTVPSSKKTVANESFRAFYCCCCCCYIVVAVVVTPLLLYPKERLCQLSQRPVKGDQIAREALGG